MVSLMWPRGDASCYGYNIGLKMHKKRDPLTITTAIEVKYETPGARASRGCMG